MKQVTDNGLWVIRKFVPGASTKKPPGSLAVFGFGYECCVR